MIRVIVFALLVTSLLALPYPAIADGGCAYRVCAGTSQTGIWGSIGEQTAPVETASSSPAVVPDAPGAWQTVPVCALGGEAICDAPSVCPNGATQQDTYFLAEDGTISQESYSCPSDAAPPAAPTLTPGRVVVAFRRLGLPESPLLIQPSGGETLVNFETVFHTTTGPFTRTVVLLGHRVRFAITPARFIWVWGDGGRRVTTWPGRPYVRGVPVSRDITHRYLTRDRFAPRLDTTYTATYSVDGGPARSVEGTVTITGTPRELATVTYTPLLVDD